MPRLHLEEDIRPLSEFRANVASFLQQVHKTGRPVVITQRGKSSAVLMDVTEYQALMDRLELLEDLCLAERQLQQGQGAGHEEAKAAALKRLGR